MDPRLLTSMAQRYMGRAQPNPAKRPWSPGVSMPGGTPSKSPLIPEGPPGAPNVATRVSPGTVPPRKRGYRPEMRPI